MKYPASNDSGEKRVGSEQIFVTQPSLPPLEDFIPLLRSIWAGKQLTNGGPFHNELERALCDYLGVKHLSLFSSGTTALLVALKVIGVRGEVITTPYSFVATAHAITWAGVRPVFVDIDPTTFNLDPAALQAAITPETSAILPVHCYGIPCDVDAVGSIARKNRLGLIYDAAHAFSVHCNGRSLLEHGDLSVLSFHATKVFSTFEGGAIISHDADTKAKIDRFRNFGFTSEITVEDVGLNGKMNEVCAAFGLLQLQRVDELIRRNKAISMRYRVGLAGVNGIRLVCGREGGNYAYFPLLVEEAFPISRDALYLELRKKGIHARRYFFPLISQFPMYREEPSSNPASLPVATRVADQVICIPIYPDMDYWLVDRVIEAIRKA